MLLSLIKANRHDACQVRYNSDLPDLHVAQWGIEVMVLAFNWAVKESVLKTSLFPSSQMIYILSNYMCYVQFGELA